MIPFSIEEHPKGRMSAFRSISKFFKTGLTKRLSQPRHPDLHASCPELALKWLRAYGYLRTNNTIKKEHSCTNHRAIGYFIPTFLRYGEKELAASLAKLLIPVKKNSGSYTFNSIPCIFDAGQMLRGLIVATDLVLEALDASCFIAEHLYSQMLDRGKCGFIKCYSDTVPESVNLYSLPPLVEAARTFQRAEYEEAVRNCVEYYCNHKNALPTKTSAHFLVHELEALIDLGHPDLAIPILDNLIELQTDDGFICTADNKNQVSSATLSHLALCWYKIGRWESANKALDWLEKNQNKSGGFCDSNVLGESFFIDVELPLTAKFYLDANWLRVISFMNQISDILPSEISLDDGRVKEILKVVKSGDEVVEVGCGKGRFLKAIRHVYPDTECVGVDIAEKLLAELPLDIRKLEGALEDIPLPVNSFDVVFSVEAIEHSVNKEAAVSEMIRIAKPGGWIVIIDKQESQWGRLQCPTWERWPEAKYLRHLLSKGCNKISYKRVSYDRHRADGLMIAWKGKKINEQRI